MKVDVRDLMNLPETGGPTVGVTIEGDVLGSPVARDGASERSETIVGLSAREATVREGVDGETVAEWGGA